MTGKELYRKYDHVSKIENEDDVFTYTEYVRKKASRIPIVMELPLAFFMFWAGTVIASLMGIDFVAYGLVIFAITLGITSLCCYARYTSIMKRIK